MGVSWSCLSLGLVLYFWEGKCKRNDDHESECGNRNRSAHFPVSVAKSEELRSYLDKNRNNSRKFAFRENSGLQADIDQFREKLNESHALIASNQQVIEYLNKQLTDRDLKTFAPLSKIH